MLFRSGRRGPGLRLLYVTQTGVHPPSFVLFCNDPARAHFSTRRHIENSLRKTFGFGAAPIRADIAFFPTLVPTRVLVVPLIIAAATSYLAVQPGALASSWLQIAVQSLLLPPAFVLSFLGGMLTRRASWLAGGVIGLMTLAGGTFVAGSADLGAMEATNPVRLVLEIYARTSADLGSVASNAYGAAVMGIFGGAFAGWYGRFLRAAGPGPRSARERRRVEAERRKGSDR